MSGQQAQKVRKNASPSTKQGPMKATQLFSLIQGSPTRNVGRKNSPSSSPTPTWGSDNSRVKSRRSPDNRASPERRSPNSPSFKVERPKPVRLSPAPSAIRRTGSLDTIAGPYLTGQWPRDFSFYPSGVPMSDKSTQTPEEWDDSGTNDKKKKGHKRSASLGNGDQLKELYKQRLQRTKEGSKQSSSSNQRQSPVHGNHAALGSSSSGSNGSGSGSSSTTQASVGASQSKAIMIPVSSIPKSGVPRHKGSVEGLNQEIEKLVLNKISGIGEDDVDRDRTQEPTPDGHRAPVAELISHSSTRSIDTQTPSGYNEDSSPIGGVSVGAGGGSSGASSSCSGGAEESRSQSVSPLLPFIPGQMDTSRPSSRSESSESASNKNDKDDGENASPEPTPQKIADSPKPNKSYAFVREPPDGCEKVKIIEEDRKPFPSLKEQLLLCPIKQSHFVPIPSVGSAFCPLNLHYKSLISAPELAVKSPASQTNAATTIESQ